MIIIIIACAFVFGIVARAIGCKTNTEWIKEFSTFLSLACVIAGIPILAACFLANDSRHISTVLYLKAVEARGIIKSYEDAIESDDKRMITARKAEIAVYNEEVEAYKRHSKNPLIGCFYPKKVAESLQYITIDERN